MRPRSITILGLEEAHEPRISSIREEGALVRFEQIFPVGRSRKILQVVVCLVQAVGDSRDAKVVVCVFQRPGDTARVGAETEVVEVVVGDVVQGLPALETPAALVGPF